MATLVGLGIATLVELLSEFVSVELATAAAMELTEAGVSAAEVSAAIDAGGESTALDIAENGSNVFRAPGEGTIRPITDEEVLAKMGYEKTDYSIYSREDLKESIRAMRKSVNLDVALKARAFPLTAPTNVMRDFLIEEDELFADDLLFSDEAIAIRNEGFRVKKTTGADRIKQILEQRAAAGETITEEKAETLVAEGQVVAGTTTDITDTDIAEIITTSAEQGEPIKNADTYSVLEASRNMTSDMIRGNLTSIIGSDPARSEEASVLNSLIVSAEESDSSLQEVINDSWEDFRDATTPEGESNVLNSLAEKFSFLTDHEEFIEFFENLYRGAKQVIVDAMERFQTTVGELATKISTGVSDTAASLGLDRAALSDLITSTIGTSDEIEGSQMFSVLENSDEMSSFELIGRVSGDIVLDPTFEEETGVLNDIIESDDISLKDTIVKYWHQFVDAVDQRAEDAVVRTMTIDYGDLEEGNAFVNFFKKLFEKAKRAIPEAINRFKGAVGTAAEKLAGPAKTIAPIAGVAGGLAAVGSFAYNVLKPNQLQRAVNDPRFADIVPKDKSGKPIIPTDPKDKKAMENKILGRFRELNDRQKMKALESGALQKALPSVKPSRFIAPTEADIWKVQQPLSEQIEFGSPRNIDQLPYFNEIAAEVKERSQSLKDDITGDSLAKILMKSVPGTLGIKLPKIPRKLKHGFALGAVGASFMSKLLDNVAPESEPAAGLAGLLGVAGVLSDQVSKGGNSEAAKVVKQKIQDTLASNIDSLISTKSDLDSLNNVEGVLKRDIKRINDVILGLRPGNQRNSLLMRKRNLERQLLRTRHKKAIHKRKAASLIRNSKDKLIKQSAKDKTKMALATNKVKIVKKKALPKDCFKVRLC